MQSADTFYPKGKRYIKGQRTPLAGLNLSGARLWRAVFESCDLPRANFAAAELHRAIFRYADLNGANFAGADLYETDLYSTNLSGATLTDARLLRARLVQTNLSGATLVRCQVHGVSAWDLQTDDRTTQRDLIISKHGEPVITVDDIEVAQFIALLLDNQKVRRVINTLTTKGVLILGRFTPERKAVLDALRTALREHDYLPLLFDFDIPEGRDITETVTLLARMSRFIVADLTEPSSIPHELQAIVPDLAVPVQPLLHGADRPYSMFKDHWKYDWVLGVHRYDDLPGLLASLADKVIAPAEAKATELAARKTAAMTGTPP